MTAQMLKFVMMDRIWWKVIMFPFLDSEAGAKMGTK